jgi:hypothetical protein
LNSRLKKVTFVSMSTLFLILFLLTAMLPFVTAHSLGGDTITALPASVPVTIDGVWSAGEWADALQYTMQDPTWAGLTSYIRAKYNSTHLLVVIDSVNDTSIPTAFPSENTWIAIDTAHDGGFSYPQWDDYLFHVGGTLAWQGNTTGWLQTWVSFAGMQCSNWWGPGLLPSPNEATPHRIDEMAIPLTHVGSPGSTVGFYAQSAEDLFGAGWGTEWPVGAWGVPWGWPGNGSAVPCPIPDAWGNLVLSPSPPPPVGGKATPITITIDKLALLIGLASAMTIVVVSVVHVKRRKKQN